MQLKALCLVALLVPLLGCQSAPVVNDNCAISVVKKESPRMTPVNVSEDFLQAYPWFVEALQTRDESYFEKPCPEARRFMTALEKQGAQVHSDAITSVRYRNATFDVIVGGITGH